MSARKTTTKLQPKGAISTNMCDIYHLLNAGTSSTYAKTQFWDRKLWPIVLFRSRTGTIRPIIDTKIATPPIRGIGFLWTVRTPGWSAALRRRASQITTGVIINARKAEPRYTDR